MKETKFSLGELANMAILLIEAEMKTTKLLYGISTAGIDISPFNSRISDAVFSLACISLDRQTDELKDWYFKQIERVFQIEITDEQKLHETARNILLMLVNWKAPEKLFGTEL